jgi:hypothetical protein
MFRDHPIAQPIKQLQFAAFRVIEAGTMECDLALKVCLKFLSAPSAGQSRGC